MSTESHLDTQPSPSSQRGHLSDWTTQRWVRMTGRSVTLSECPWLVGPHGDVDVIGADFYARVAQREGLRIDTTTRPRGLLRLAALEGPRFDPARVAAGVARFYAETSEYDLDAWSRWSPLFRPFGGALATLFSRRLQQLNVPLSPLDTSRGMDSRVLTLRDAAGEPRYTAWVRTLSATRETIYAGSYDTTVVPGFEGGCVRVMFPLPNGHACVVMWPEAEPDGSLRLHSSGARFGDPGFYFYVARSADEGWARYLPTFRETIHVYDGEPRDHPRADHSLSIWGRRFLELHYRMRRLA